MKTVAVLRANPKDTGIGKVLQTLSKKHMVDCYIWDRKGDYQPIIEHKNIRYRPCHIRAGFYNVATLLKLVLFETWLLCKLVFAKIDCIYAVDLDTGLVGLCVAKFRRKPFIYHCGDPYYTILPPRWPKILGTITRRIENIIISKADLFVITDILRMPQHEGAKPKQIVEIANVPMMDFQLVPCMRSGSEFIVGYIGVLVEGRNLLTIIDAVGELEKEGIKLIIGGYGPIRGELETRAAKYGNVIFIGEVPYLPMNSEVLRIESSFDMFVYTTDPNDICHKWISPNKLFESMVLGKPIIASENTLLAERVSKIGNGMLVEYGSKVELKKAILNLKSKPDLLAEMGKMGREEFVRNWRPEIMEERLLEAYLKVTGDTI